LNLKTTHLIALQSISPVLLGFPNHVGLLKMSAINFFHKSFFDQYKSFESQNLKTNSRKYWIHECGMDATRFPSLRCILKQCLKLAQEVVYGKQKVFLADSKYILRSSFCPFKSSGNAYAKA